MTGLGMGFIQRQDWQTDGGLARHGLELIAKVDTGRAGRDFALRRGVERESRSGGTKQLHDERATKPQGKGTPALRVAFLEASGGVARRSQTSAGMLPSRALPDASRKCNTTHGYFCNEF